MNGRGLRKRLNAAKRRDVAAIHAEAFDKSVKAKDPAAALAAMIEYRKATKSKSAKRGTLTPDMEAYANAQGIK